MNIFYRVGRIYVSLSCKLPDLATCCCNLIIFSIETKSSPVPASSDLNLCFSRCHIRLLCSTLYENFIYLFFKTSFKKNNREATHGVGSGSTSAFEPQTQAGWAPEGHKVNKPSLVKRDIDEWGLQQDPNSLTLYLQGNLNVISCYTLDQLIS